jgi:Ca2+-binding EF-hand superfamily protein
MKRIAVLGLVVAASVAAPALAQDAALVFAALDANKDGKVTQAEAQKNAAVVQMFGQADKNKDGSLSKDEFQAAFGR